MTDNQAYTASLEASIAKLVAALKGAVTILDEVDAYQKRPERGDYGVECACCMGEMFDQHDYEQIARARDIIADQEGCGA